MLWQRRRHPGAGFKLCSENSELTVTYANASYNDDMELQIRQLEKFIVHDWEYTDKGWLI